MFHRPFTGRKNSFTPRFNRHNKSRQRNFGRPSFGQSIPSSHYIRKSVDPVDSPRYVNNNTFNDFPIDKRLKANILAHGYTQPTPIQDQGITPILEGRDVVGIANTGTGKTAAFLIPLINKILLNTTERVLIVVPTRELAAQVSDELKAFSLGLSIFSQILIGGASMYQQIAGLKKSPHFLIATPGRLKDLIMQKRIRMQDIHTIVLDEVDRMVDIGFIKDIRYVVSLLPTARQSLFFSATVSPEIQSIMNSFLKNPVTISVKFQETAEHIEQDVIRIRSKDEKMAKLNELLHKEEFKKVLIFGRTKWGVEKLSKALLQKGFSAASIHGNKSQGQRSRVLTQFKQNQLQVLVATDIAARGLDIVDVTHVINFDEPATPIDYIHRIGRTGRAEKSGKALTFVM